MTKEQENRSVEEYFEKVRNGEVVILIMKKKDRETDLHDPEMDVEQGGVEECSNCAKLLRHIEILKESLHNMSRWG